MITGVHAIIFNSQPERLRAWFRGILGLASVDAREGWPIFALPPAELAVHPLDDNAGRHDLYLMYDDIKATAQELKAKAVEFATPVTDQGLGFLVPIKVSGGGELGLYQPKHPIVIKVATGQTAALNPSSGQSRAFSISSLRPGHLALGQPLGILI